MTENILPGLKSLISNCINQMDVYAYGDSHMNPWNLYVSRGLFNLVEAL
jgi:hypothetical protein